MPGIIRPMILTSGQECVPPVPPPFSTDTASDFYAAGLEVYDVSVSLTPEQKTIVEYWSDNAGAIGTPPGHWIAIVSQIAWNDNLSLAATAEAALSRLYGDIHFSFDNDDGLASGHCIGQVISDRVSFKDDG